MDARKVVAEPAQFAAHAAGKGEVGDFGDDQRQEPFGIEGHEAGGRSGEIAVTGVGGAAVEPGAFRIALAEAGEGIDFRCRGQVVSAVQKQGEVADRRIAVAVGVAIEGQLARIGVSGHTGELLPRIGGGAVGGIAILELPGEIQITVRPHRQADIRRQRQRAPIAARAIFSGIGQLIDAAGTCGRIEHRLVGPVHDRTALLQHAVHIGAILAIRDLRAPALGTPQPYIDDPRDRVGSVLGGCAIAQDFDPLDRQRRDGVEIDRRAAASDRPVQIEQGGSVTTLAVDEHQRLVGRQAPQGCRAQRIRTVGNRGLGEVEAGHQLIEDLVDLGVAGIVQCVPADDVDRNRTVRCGAIRPAGSDDDDLFLRGLRFFDRKIGFVRRLLSQRGRCEKSQSGRRSKQRDTRHSGPSLKHGSCTTTQYCNKIVTPGFSLICNMSPERHKAISRRPKSLISYPPTRARRQPARNCPGALELPRITL